VFKEIVYIDIFYEKLLCGGRGGGDPHWGYSPNVDTLILTNE